MRRVVVLVVLAGCDRLLGLNPIVDAPRTMGDAADAPVTYSDAPVATLVQVASTSSMSGTTSLELSTSVTAGDMVLVVCGTGDNNGPCTITTAPATLPGSWTAVDPGMSLNASVLCSAPAISAITIQTNRPGPVAAIISEWSGATVTNCVDQVRKSVQCSQGPWSVPLEGSTLNNNELLVAAGMATTGDAHWAVDAPFALSAEQAEGSAVDAFIAGWQINPSPVDPIVSGEVGAFTGVCWTDLFVFEEAGQ